MLKIGDQLPAGTLFEYVEVEGNGCSIGPNAFDVAKETAGKKIAIFALPGAYTPTCSAQHLPGYIAQADAFKAAGKVRMMGDGGALFTQATGLVLDLTAKGFGVRSQRYSMLVDNGVVKTLNVEGPGKFEVSDAATLLAQAQG